MWSLYSHVKFNVIVFIALVCWGISGCSTLETIGDYVKDNPIIASASFRYATAKYINRGDTEIERSKRSSQVIERVSKLKEFIVENPTITVSGVMQYLDETIDWGEMDLSDRILIQDILTIVKADLSVHEVSNPLVNIKELLDTVISAALLYGR